MTIPCRSAPVTLTLLLSWPSWVAAQLAPVECAVVLDAEDRLVGGVDSVTNAPQVVFETEVGFTRVGVNRSRFRVSRLEYDTPDCSGAPIQRWVDIVDEDALYIRGVVDGEQQLWVLDPDAPIVELTDWWEWDPEDDSCLAVSRPGPWQFKATLLAGDLDAQFTPPYRLEARPCGGGGDHPGRGHGPRRPER